MSKYKTIKHRHELGDFHEFTFSCYKQMSLLTNDDWRRALSKHVAQACIETRFDLVAFVFMPNLVHLLTYPRDPEPSFDRFLSQVKRPFSKEIKDLLTEENSPLLHKLMIRERPRKYVFRFWQEGPGYDRNIHSQRALKIAIDYIHLNPVRKGFCDRAIDWHWSSARYYLLEPPKQQFATLPHINGIPEGTFDDRIRR